MKVYWFGCDTKPASAGHFLHPAQPPYHGPESYEERQGFPFRWEMLDGGFAPREEKPARYSSKGDEFAQGQARVTYVGGWTVVAFWDRTGDARGASNTAFIFDEHLAGPKALTIAREKFPKLFERFPFPVEIVETVGTTEV